MLITILKLFMIYVDRAFEDVRSLIFDFLVTLHRYRLKGFISFDRKIFMKIKL